MREAAGIINIENNQLTEGQKRVRAFFSTDNNADAIRNAVKPHEPVLHAGGIFKQGSRYLKVLLII